MVRPAQGLPVCVRLPGQGHPRTSATCSRPTAPESWCVRPPCRRKHPESYSQTCRPGWSPRSTARGSPTSTPPGEPGLATTTAPAPELWKQTEGRYHPLRGRRRHLRARSSCTGRYPSLRSAAAGLRVHSAPTRRASRLLRRVRPALTWFEGVGEDFWPVTYDRDICDEIIAVSDADSFDMNTAPGPRGRAAGRRLLRHGRGPRRCAWPERLGPGRVVVVLPARRRPRATLSKVFNDRWMSAYGFLPAGHVPAPRSAMCCGAKDAASCRHLVHTHTNETVGDDGSASLREFGVSQMPVVNAEPPVMMAAEVAGAVIERTLLDPACQPALGPVCPTGCRAAPCRPPLPANRCRASRLSVAMSALYSADGAMVLVDGNRPAVVTRHDVLGSPSPGAESRPNGPPHATCVWWPASARAMD